jgi:hypothetical protein
VTVWLSKLIKEEGEGEHAKVRVGMRVTKCFLVTSVASCACI